MSKILKRLSAYVLVALTVLNMVGTNISVSASETDTVSGTIEVIFNRNEADMQPYIKAFEDKYPGVKVKYTCYNDLEAGLKERIETGDYGDVMYFPSFVSTEDASKYFEPLGDYDTLSAKYNYLEQGRYYDNVVYGVPSSAYLMGIVYNKEVFDKAGITSLPKTIDEFLYAMYLVSEHTDALPFYAGYSEPWVLGNWEVFPFIEMTGTASYKFSNFVMDVNPFREGTVHNKTLRLLYDLVEKGYTEVGGDKMGWWDSVVKMNNGEVACSVIGTWALHNYKNVGPNGDNIGFMPFPNNIDGKQYVTVSGDYSYAVSKNSKNKEAAKAFVNFMLDESGYAFDHETLSVLKSDPIPKCYGDLTHTSILNVSYATAEAYTLYNTLTANLNLYDQNEYVRIVEAAAGIREESFEDVMNDWNTRWETARNNTDIKIDIEDPVAGPEDTIVDIGSTKIELSQNETDYISSNPTIKVGYHKNLAPFSFEKNGVFKGIAYDICRLISNKTGLSMEYYGYETTEKLTDALKAGEIDCIAGVENMPDSTGIRYSKEYLEYMDVIVRHNTVDTSALKKFSGTDGEKYKSYEIASETITNHTVKGSLDAVEHLMADFTITNYYSANYYMRANRYDDMTVIPYANNQTYHMGFSDTTSPMLIAIVNKCIYSLADGEVEILLMEYMDEVVGEISLETFIRANPIPFFIVIILIFSMIFLWMYERYRVNNRQLMEAKKYTLLASLAEESFFEYNHKKTQIKFDSKFVNVIGGEPLVALSSYDGSNRYLNQFMEQITPVLKELKDGQVTIELTSVSGEKQWYRVVTSVVLDNKKQPVLTIGKIINIQREMEEVASYQDKAYRDSLTKLYNREGLIANIPHGATGVMVAVMDMDDFKNVNDTLGHSGGDYALTFFADRLRKHMGQDALLARYGGDEFIVVLTGISLNDARDRLTGLVESMRVNLRYAGNSCRISVSAGAVYSESIELFEDAFDKADKMLYKTKAEGKNKCNITEG